MKQSQLVSKTRKEAPKDEVAKNAQLLIKAGYIAKQMAGVYAYLPLGLRVLTNIIAIIRDEMNNVGGQELLLSALQDKDPWIKSGRWADPNVDSWFKTTLKNDTELGLGFTHEEPLAKTLSEHIHSYKQLPAYPYQIQLKFRNETRAKSGIMRTREFIMKDLYSLSRSDEEHETFYTAIQTAYKNIFDRCGIGDITFFTFASGGVFSPFSHEFQTLCEAGEDIIYLDETKGMAVNKEVYTDEVLEKLGLDKKNLVEKKAIEVGNIFSLGTKYSEALGLTFTDQKGSEQPVVMGSYGIGPGRLMGTVVEVCADDKGIIWPKPITPFQAHLLSIGNDKNVIEKAKELYEELSKNYTVLWDDRDESPGVKFNDSDLLGIPVELIVSKKNGTVIEMKDRHSNKILELSNTQELSSELKKAYA